MGELKACIIKDKVNECNMWTFFLITHEMKLESMKNIDHWKKTKNTEKYKKI